MTTAVMLSRLPVGIALGVAPPERPMRTQPPMPKIRPATE